jgi:hypothetical protein
LHRVHRSGKDKYKSEFNQLSAMLSEPRLEKRLQSLLVDRGLIKVSRNCRCCPSGGKAGPCWHATAAMEKLINAVKL